MNEKLIVFGFAISLVVFFQNPGYGDPAKIGADEMSVVVDCDKVAFFPLLRTKLGCARTLSTGSLESFHQGLEYIDEFDPAIFNIPLNFSSLREKPKDFRKSDNVLMDPYPVCRDGSGEVHVEPPDAELVKGHQALQQRRIIILHQLMGAPRPWYNEDPTLIRLKRGQKKPFFDDRFPVPTDVTAAADAMGRWCNGYQSSFPVNWGIWQEADHYLRYSRPDLGAPEYANIVLNYVRGIRRHATPESIDRQTFALQLLPRGSTKPWPSLQGSEMGSSFLEALLFTMEKGLRPGEKLSDFIDYVNLNNYRASMGKKAIDFHSELRAVRELLLKHNLNTTGFVYTQMTLGDKLVDPSGERDRYKNSVAAAIDMADLWSNLLAAVDVDITCWDFMLGSTGSKAMFSVDPDGGALYSPRAQTLRLIRTMPTRRVFSQADAGIRTLASVSDGRAGDRDDRAAILLWSHEQMPGQVDVHLSVKSLPDALFTNDETRLYVYRIDDAHNSRWGEAAKPVDVVSAVRKDGVLPATITMKCPGVVFIRIGADLPAKLQAAFTDAEYCRKFSWCDRSNDSDNKISDSYGVYDYKYSRAYLGVKGNQGRAIAGAMFQKLPDTLTASVRTDNVLATKNKNAILALRVDFFNDDRQAIKSVLWTSSILDSRRKRVLPWGKGGALADVIAGDLLSLDGETTLDIANYAPKNWNRKAIISFWMEGTGDESMAEFRLHNFRPRQ